VKFELVNLTDLRSILESIIDEKFPPTKHSNQEEEKLMSANELAKRFGVCRKTIENWSGGGRFKQLSIEGSRLVFYNLAEVKKAMKERE